MGAARVLLDTGYLEEIISLVHYPMYHARLALFLKARIKCENHTGIIALLRQVAKREDLAERLSEAKSARIDTQYYTDTETTKRDVEISIEEGQDFIIAVKAFINRLDEKKVKDINRSIEDI